MTDATPGRRMVRLLPRQQRLSSRFSLAVPTADQSAEIQHDLVSCREARVRLKRMGRNLFRQQLAFRVAQRRCQQEQHSLQRRSRLRLQLNPIRTWARLASRLMLDGVDPPANVLFFATPSGPSAALLELEDQALLNELEDWQPCTLDEWAALSHVADRPQLLDFCLELSRIGVVAWSAPAEVEDGHAGAVREQASVAD